MSNGAKVQIQKSKILVVEGKDEVNFFEGALAKHLANAAIQVLGIGGKLQLSRSLSALIADANFPSVQCLAVVRDADFTPPGSSVAASSAAFDSVTTALLSNGLTCPAGHALFAAGPPRVGVFIMPNGADDGMLETLCLQSVVGNPEYPCLTDYFSCLQGHGAVPNNMHKGTHDKDKLINRISANRLAIYILFP